MLDVPFKDRSYNCIYGGWSIENLWDAEVIRFLKGIR